MELTIIIDYLIISIIASMAINSLFRNYAKQNAILIDLPDRSRKFHKRPTPLIGGLGIFFALFLSGKIYIDLNNLSGYLPSFSQQLFLVSIPLLILFLIDDVRGIKPSIRLLIQVMLTTYMIISTDVYLKELGDLFGFGIVNLGIFAIPVTVFCVVGIMNAFNMIDGINGLCAGCAMLSLLFIGFYSSFIYDSMLVLIIGSILGFLIFNLRFFGKKRGVFLGDSGSNLIGFWVAWIAIYCSQNQLYSVEPITMLWFVAIPILDCIGLIFSRIRKRISISSPGRDHIHHKLMRKFSSEQTLAIILVMSILNGLIGVYLDNNYASWVSTLSFLLFASIYFAFNNYYSHIFSKIKKYV
jgi:UDP-GlcNAc:undecaprenyl-phosphate GlcNAc-1-phosphate transferase